MAAGNIGVLINWLMVLESYYFQLDNTEEEKVTFSLTFKKERVEELGVVVVAGGLVRQKTDKELG